MKKLFYSASIAFILFEIANVYFIMPMYGSQEIPSIDVAYFLYNYRWVFRSVLGLMVVLGFLKAFQSDYKYAKYLSSLVLALVMGVSYATNYQMAADEMFLKPTQLILKDAAQSTVKTDKLIIGITLNGQAKAYPIQYMGYHHQVLDSIDNQPIMVTYCTVCRTGRVFQPIVNGKTAQFRLVGMDHFNALFEDKTTKSWWQQATGTAITGTLKGQALPEIYSQQMALKQWLLLHPNSQIMQADSTFKEEYADMDTYDLGKGRGKLTGTDSLSWKQKSWVIGVDMGSESKAYDWNRVVKERIVNDFVGNKPILIALAKDSTSFFAFERPSVTSVFYLQNDTLMANNQYFTLDGARIEKYVIDDQKTIRLKPIKAYQEFWHSWLNFHPKTLKY
jgi:Protein of unknown function (DUF3179)